MPNNTTTNTLTARNGGQILVQQLRIHGTKRVFIVPGESYLPCIDALYDHQDYLQTVVCRQESGAAYMAEATGKLTGEPGVCFVTRGPGATNASIGVHTAFQDSTPMILFIGQVGNDFVEREAFQEVDYRRMFGVMAKWVAQIDRTDRIPEYIARAYSVATSGRPGPVVLALPEDTLWGTATVADAPKYCRATIAPSASDLTQLQTMLEKAERPMVIVGGSGWTDTAQNQLKTFAQRFNLPMTTAWRRLECYDQYDEQFAGHVGWSMFPALRERIAHADLVLAINTRLGEPTTEGYTLIESPTPKQTLIHIHASAEELGRVFHPTLAIVAQPVGIAEGLATLTPSTTPKWVAHTQAARQDYLESLIPLPAEGAVNINVLAEQVNKRLPRSAVVTVGAGNYALYPHRYRQFAGLGTSLAPTVGSMGYGLPAAVAAKIHDPQKTVVCYAGDGCFQMNLQELGVALQYELGIVILLFNNSIWGTIRAHQEREFPSRNHGLTFTNPDYVQLIKAYEGQGERVTHTEDFAAAFDRALDFADKNRRPALVEIRYDNDQIAPGETLTLIRETALKQK